MRTTTKPSILMNLDNPSWNDFDGQLGAAVDRLGCKGGNNKTIAKRIMRKLSLDKAAIEASCRWFEGMGGYCDCEIVLNVARRAKMFEGAGNGFGERPG